MSIAEAKIADKVFNFTPRIAAEFSTSKSYSVGDYCIYQNKLYRFTSAKSSGSWSSSAVTSTNVMQEITNYIDPRPVGTIYLSYNSTSPATLFGGTWSQIKDRFLLAAGSSYTAGSTGGEATHTLTVSEMPAHTHSYEYNPRTGQVIDGAPSYGTYYTGNSSALTSYDSGSKGSGSSHNNMPPYLVVYAWQRTA